MDENETMIEQDPVDIIEDLRNNSVSKSEFDKLKAQNTKLLKALANGEKIENKATVDMKTLRNELYGSDRKELSNVEYVTKTLQLRQAIIDAGSADPFLPIGHQVAPTKEDIASAANLAEVLQECLDYAQGDTAVFTNELQRRTLDMRLPNRG